MPITYRSIKINFGIGRYKIKLYRSYRTFRNGVQSPYPFNYFVYFHERLLQLRGREAAGEGLRGLAATVVCQLRTAKDAPETLGRLFAGMVEVETQVCALLLWE